MSGDASIVSSGLLTLANTTVTPGTYTKANITVNSKGLITSALSESSLVSQTTVAAITTAGNVTWTATQMLGGILTRNCNGGARNDTTSTAALLVSQFNTQYGRVPIIGDTVTLTIINNSPAANILTISAGVGITLVVTTQTIAQNIGKNALIRFTNVTGGSESATIYLQ